MKVLVVLKTQESKEPPAEIEAQVYEHMGGGEPGELGIGVFLDLSQLSENKHRARGWILDHNGNSLAPISVMVIAEQQQEQ